MPQEASTANTLHATEAAAGGTASHVSSATWEKSWVQHARRVVGQDPKPDWSRIDDTSSQYQANTTTSYLKGSPSPDRTSPALRLPRALRARGARRLGLYKARDFVTQHAEMREQLLRYAHRHMDTVSHALHVRKHALLDKAQPAAAHINNPAYMPALLTARPGSALAALAEEEHRQVAAHADDVLGAVSAAAAATLAGSPAQHSVLVPSRAAPDSPTIHSTTEVHAGSGVPTARQLSPYLLTKLHASGVRPSGVTGGAHVLECSCKSCRARAAHRQAVSGAMQGAKDTVTDPLYRRALLSGDVDDVLTAAAEARDIGAAVREEAAQLARAEALLTGSPVALRAYSAAVAAAAEDIASTPQGFTVLGDGSSTQRRRRPPFTGYAEADADDETHVTARAVRHSVWASDVRRRAVRRVRAALEASDVLEDRASQEEQYNSGGQGPRGSQHQELPSHLLQSRAMRAMTGRVTKSVSHTWARGQGRRPAGRGRHDGSSDDGSDRSSQDGTRRGRQSVRPDNLKLQVPLSSKKPASLIPAGAYIPSSFIEQVKREERQQRDGSKQHTTRTLHRAPASMASGFTGHMASSTAGTQVYGGHQRAKASRSEASWAPSAPPPSMIAPASGSSDSEQEAGPRSVMRPTSTSAKRPASAAAAPSAVASSAWHTPTRSRPATAAATPQVEPAPRLAYAESVRTARVQFVKGLRGSSGGGAPPGTTAEPGAAVGAPKLARAQSQARSVARSIATSRASTTWTGYHRRRAQDETSSSGVYLTAAATGSLVGPSRLSGRAASVAPSSAWTQGGGDSTDPVDSDDDSDRGTDARTAVTSAVTPGRVRAKVSHKLWGAKKAVGAPPAPSTVAPTRSALKSSRMPAPKGLSRGAGSPLDSEDSEEEAATSGRAMKRSTTMNTEAILERSVSRVHRSSTMRTAVTQASSGVQGRSGRFGSAADFSDSEEDNDKWCQRTPH